MEGEGKGNGGREGRGKREREVPPVITVPPGPRGARIVTDLHYKRHQSLLYLPCISCRNAPQRNSPQIRITD